MFTYKFVGVMAGLSLFGLSINAPAMAGIVNGSFENGLDNWTVITPKAPNFVGSNGIATTTGTDTVTRFFQSAPGSTTETTSPQDGLLQAKLGSPTGPLSGPSNGAELPLALLLAPTGLNRDNGTAIYQDISVAAGDILTFDWNFVYGDLQSSTSDFAFFTIASVGGSTPGSAFVLDPASNNSAVNYQQRSFTFGSSGTYRVGLGVANEGNLAGTSYAYFDNVQVVPEPSATLGTLVLLVGGFRLRRSRLRSH